MSRIHKAVAVVLRHRDGLPQVLVFRHPLAGVQIPKGTVKAGESIAAATLRELVEESGLVITAPPIAIGQWERVVDCAPEAVQLWHIGLIPAPPGLPDAWDHAATGSLEEDGLVFSYFWTPVDDDLGHVLHPLFEPTIEIVRIYLK